jgi:hypothetical protein
MMSKEEIKEYKRQYARGWNASERGSEGALERMDFREPNNTAWYDGYHDSAAGRDKFVAESGLHRITGEKK